MTSNNTNLISVMVAFFCLTYAVYSGAVEAKVLEVSINNQLTVKDSRVNDTGVTLQAAIRLGNGNSWDSLDALSPGMNNFLISVNDNHPITNNLLVITFPDGSKYASSLPAPNQNNKIDIRLDNVAVNADVNSKSKQAANPEKYFLQTTMGKTSYPFYEIPKGAKYTWTAECNAKVSASTGDMKCRVASDPQIQFKSTEVKGAYYATWTKGVVTSNFDPDEMIAKSHAGKRHSIHYKFAATGKVGIQWGSLSDILASFSGSGIAAGAGKGRGVFDKDAVNSGEAVASQ